jgi:hypothetical protein
MKSLLAFVAIGCCFSGVAMAQDGSCADLWYRRNEIYKDAGYCFKTSRAIRTFGNAGCLYDVDADVPLSPGERGVIAGIVRRERYLACPR